MSRISPINEVAVASGGSIVPRTWAGPMAQAEGRARHYLHLMAYPCEQCKGPVVAGWICKREDEKTKEIEVTGMGAICLCCGSRAEAPIDPLPACHFRPVEWEWISINSQLHLSPTGDPLPPELSQDADRDSQKFAAESQP